MKETGFAGGNALGITVVSPSPINKILAGYQQSNYLEMMGEPGVRSW